MGCSMSITGVIERLVLAMEEVRVAGVELVMTTDGVVARDLTMIGVVGVVSVGADGVVVSLGSQSSKLY
jgi:hypothetical protein